MGGRDPDCWKEERCGASLAVGFVIEGDVDWSSVNLHSLLN